MADGRCIIKPSALPPFLKLFQQTCFACHTMNREGPSQVGPDLNLPLNPTEYFKESVLPQYIRNPKSIRSWERSKMPGFGPEAFSDEGYRRYRCLLERNGARKIPPGLKLQARRRLKQAKG